MPEQQIHPDQGQIESAKREPGPERTQRSVSLHPSTPRSRNPDEKIAPERGAGQSAPRAARRPRCVRREERAACGEKSAPRAARRARLVFWKTKNRANRATPGGPRSGGCPEYLSPMAAGAQDLILDSVAHLLAQRSRLVLAVSGGIDSMTLLDAVARMRSSQHHVVVASFDHGTGASAREAAAVAAFEAARRELPVRTGSATQARPTEAVWREARWGFLRAVAHAENAVVATGHTRDDQIETVFMRLLRGAGPRGLAGLLESTGIARPLLGLSRREVQRYATERGVRFVEDPSNASRHHQRNRVRLDFLPALRAAVPGFDESLLALAGRSGSWRADFDAVAASFLRAPPANGEVEVDASMLQGYPPWMLRYLWQSIAAAGGIILDRRALNRLARFAERGRCGQRVPVSGGVEVIRGRSSFWMRRAPQGAPPGLCSLPKSGLRFGPWHFLCLPGTTINSNARDPWVTALPANRDLAVRAWQPGDRLLVGADGSERKVKRFFSDAGVVGPLREGWPVVLLEGKVVWIPGIRRGAGSICWNQSEPILYRCERLTR